MKKMVHWIWVVFFCAFSVLDLNVASVNASPAVEPTAAGREAQPHSVLQAQTVAAGVEYSCALTQAGGVVCWGYGLDGQLGNGQSNNQKLPVPVSGLSSGVAAVSAGVDHACALTVSGGVKCWGANASGQLGNGATSPSSVPQDVSGLTGGVAAISAGGGFTCALLSTGGLKCWGANGLGQLGSGSAGGFSSLPQDVPDLAGGVQALSAGVSHACVVTAAGGVKCWGSNSSGKLGNGVSGGFSASPVDVSGIPGGATQVSAGWAHTCAVVTGGVKCWGNNMFSQVGSSEPGPLTTPVDVGGLAGGVTAVSAGWQHSCAITGGGGVKCWGNGLQLGSGYFINLSAAPLDVLGLAGGVTQISAGYNHTCAVAPTGVKCWGLNNSSQLSGGPDAGFLTSPQDVSGLAGGVQALAAGYLHTCAITGAGGVKCWGGNDEGQVGDGSRYHRSLPVDVTGLDSGIQAIAAGYDFTCALNSLGGVLCWGANLSGQLGDGTNERRTEPVAVLGLPADIVALAAGNSHACSLDSSGGVWCWGANDFGQLGDGSMDPSNQAVFASRLPLAAGAIGAGTHHTCALAQAGGLKCWGGNGFGQLGDGTNAGSVDPLDVVDLSTGVERFDSGSFHNCAVLSGGGIKCWGLNNTGQLGNNSTIMQAAPVDVTAFPGLGTKVSAGFSHSCAVTDTGGIACWGRNHRGQLGDGTTLDRLTPVQVLGLGAVMAAVESGADHTCALTQTGRVKCWGSNLYGQLGSRQLWAPVDVLMSASQVFLPVVNR